MNRINILLKAASEKLDYKDIVNLYNAFVKIYKGDGLSREEQEDLDPKISVYLDKLIEEWEMDKNLFSFVNEKDFAKIVLCCKAKNMDEDFVLSNKTQLLNIEEIKPIIENDLRTIEREYNENIYYNENADDPEMDINDFAVSVLHCFSSRIEFPEHMNTVDNYIVFFRNHLGNDEALADRLEMIYSIFNCLERYFHGGINFIRYFENEGIEGLLKCYEVMDSGATGITIEEISEKCNFFEEEKQRYFIMAGINEFFNGGLF